MPIAEVELPDGRIAEFDVPEGATEQQILAFAAQTFPTIQQAPSFGSRVAGDIEQRGVNISDIAQIREGGTQSGIESSLQTFGQGVAAGGDIIGRGIQSAAETGFEALPDIDQATLRLIGEDIKNSVVGQLGIQALQSGTEAYGAFREENPRAARNIEAFLNIATGGLIGGGIRSGTKVLAEVTPDVIKTAIPKVIETAKAGVQTAGKTIAKPVERLVRGRTADQVLANRITADQASEALGELQKGKISVLADVAGDEVQGFTRAVGKVSGGARNIVADALEGRSEAAVTRVSNALSKNISNVETYFANLDDIAKARASAASPVYRKAYSQGKQLKVTTRLNTLINDQRIVSAMDEAKSTLGVSAEAPRNSIELIDGAKKILDDRISVAVRAGANEQAKAIDRLKKELLKEADRQVPAYKQARKIFSDFKSLENAQEAGLQFISQTPEELRRLIKLMDNTQKEAFKIGVRQNLQNTVSKTADQADPAKRVFGNEFKRDQLKAIFGEGDQFNSFTKLMREEIRAAKTKFKVLGGSRTDINQADNGQFITAAVDAVRGGFIKTTVDTAIGSIAKSIQNKWIGLNSKNAKELARILTDRSAGIEALERLIKNAQKEQKIIVREAVEELGAQ